MIDSILMSCAILALLVASYTDLRWREVPDWVNYALIFAAIGVRSIYALTDAMILVSGLMGFVFCMLIGFFFYYTDQWGGGDTKLLMGMGAIIGVPFPFSIESLGLLWFLAALLFCGALWGMLWMVYEMLRNWQHFFAHFKKKLQEHWKIQAVVGGVIAILLLVSIYAPALWPLALFLLISMYTFFFVHSVEKTCFVHSRKITDLVAGDWLAAPVKQAKLLMHRKTLTDVDLLLLQKHNITHVLVKEGVPFVPGFLLGYGLWLWLGDGILTTILSFL